MPKIVTACGLVFIMAAVGAAQDPPAKPAPPAPAPLTVQQIAPDLDLVTGGSGANPAFYVTANEVFAIDAKLTPEAAAGIQFLQDLIYRYHVMPSPVEEAAMRTLEREILAQHHIGSSKTLGHIAALVGVRLG